MLARRAPCRASTSAGFGSVKRTAGSAPRSRSGRKASRPFMKLSLARRRARSICTRRSGPAAGPPKKACSHSRFISS
jgi:hypothetical protein